MTLPADMRIFGGMAIKTAHSTRVHFAAVGARGRKQEKPAPDYHSPEFTKALCRTIATAKQKALAAQNSKPKA